MRQAKDWLLRTPSRRAAAARPSSLSPSGRSLALSGSEGLDGDDNESLQVTHKHQCRARKDCRTP